ncbi:MAG: 2OG-Fe(II) oxygenase [Pseudomonadota bacterium]
MSDQYILSLNPLVYVIDDFASQAFCDAAIDIGSDNQQLAKVLNEKGESTQNDRRTNTQAIIDTWAHPILAEYVTKVSKLVRLPVENTEETFILRYEGDQQFKPHKDAFPLEAKGRARLAEGGQRLFTSICYLNSVDQGGETEFPELKLIIRPKTGRLLIFGNTLLGTNAPHPHSTHAGRPCKSGSKWAMTHWWREFTYQEHRSFPAETRPAKTV